MKYGNNVIMRAESLTNASTPKHNENLLAGHKA